MARRDAFVIRQLCSFKMDCNTLLTATKEEFYALQDEHAAIRQRFMRDDSVDLGHFLSVTTRLKIHALAYRALKRMRNFEACDLSRLPRLVALHQSQIKRLGTMHYQRNATYYSHMHKRLLMLQRYLSALKAHP